MITRAGSPRRALGEDLATHGLLNPAFSYPSWRSLAAQAQHALGQADEARRLSSEDVAEARAGAHPAPSVARPRILGTVEGGEAGLGRLREAVLLLEQSPARLEHAYALTDLGGALRRAAVVRRLASHSGRHSSSRTNAAPSRSWSARTRNWSRPALGRVAALSAESMRSRRASGGSQR